MKISDQLIAAKALISNPENWTQRAFARDLRGRQVNSDADEASSWCSVGAVHKMANNYYKYLVRRALQDFVTEEYNDTHSHEEVMLMWDKAIERQIQLENE